MRQDIRQQMRKKRQSLSVKEISAYSDNLFRQYLALYESNEKIRLFKKIGFYCAFDGEIDPIFMMKYCWSRSKLKCYLPVIDHKNNTLTFKLHQYQDALKKNNYQILEPLRNDESISAGQLDLIFFALGCI
jgi:5-formyltetrahydrofolate cyclo-ligase